MKRILDRIMRPVAMPLYRSRSIRSWPSWVGRVHEINLPSTLPRKSDASPLGTANINIIFELLETVAQVPGDVAECGVFRGQTLLPMGIFLQEQNQARRVYALDSFTGLDESVDLDVRLGGEPEGDRRRGGFSKTSLEHVRNRASQFGLDGTVIFLPGYFAETLSMLPETNFAFVHLDCDIYQSYADCLAYFYPRMSSGGIILLDEYNDPHWPGCNLAVDEFLDGRPEPLRLIQRDNYEKYYFVKE